MAEQHHVGERHERRPLPSRGHIARAEVAHHAHTDPLRQHRRVAELEGRAPRLMPDRLAVRRDK